MDGALPPINGEARVAPPDTRLRLTASPRKNAPMRYEGLAEVPYNYAAAALAGAMLLTAGACPLDAEGKVVASGDHRAQAEKAVENLLPVFARPPAAPEVFMKRTFF